jgi:RimJ/RimL family protein N-acetyltransferase
VEKAEQWIAAREKDSYFYAITLNEAATIIGFLFLYREDEANDLRLGYLLDQAVWGKGIGTELIKGLVQWSRSTALIQSLSGGVEDDNMGSIKVLEKCGFHKANVEMPPHMFLYAINFEIS